MDQTSKLYLEVVQYDSQGRAINVIGYRNVKNKCLCYGNMEDENIYA